MRLFTMASYEYSIIHAEITTSLHNSVKSVVLYKVCGRTLHLANAIIIFIMHKQSSFPLSDVNFDFKTCRVNWVTNIEGMKYFECMVDLPANWWLSVEVNLKNDLFSWDDRSLFKVSLLPSGDAYLRQSSQCFMGMSINLLFFYLKDRGNRGPLEWSGPY